MHDARGLQRLALSYQLGDDGRLVARDLPARIVPVAGETALFRKIAPLADASDADIRAAASRYGPLGPVRPLSIADRALFVWAMSEQFRQYMLGIGRLRAWIATGGQTPIPGRLAPSAHLLAAIAEAAPLSMERLLQFFTEPYAPRPTEAELDRLARDFDRQEHVMLHALGRRERLLNRHLKKGDAYVRVLPKPGTGRYLGLAARYLKAVLAKADEVGPPAAHVLPDSLGRFATSLQPYIEENIVPPETVGAWRQAATELRSWTEIVRAAKSASPEEIKQAQALLTLRLQQVDAWTCPPGEQLGTFGRALRSVWPYLVRAPLPRPCTWPGCSEVLPGDAHGNRAYCDAHRREAARLRSARTRQRERSGYRAAGRPSSS